MAKIFQLELFIKEMSIWKLPHLSEDCDETCVEVTAFGIENVPINGYVFGKNSSMNRGQSFLFTLNAMPIEENKVYFNVFKKAYNREKNFLGNGKIPIDKIFDDVFSQTFNGTKTKRKTSNRESISAAIRIAADQKAAGATSSAAFDPNQPTQNTDVTSTWNQLKNWIQQTTHTDNSDATQETENATSATMKKSVTSATPSTTDATAKNAAAGSSSPATAAPDTTADSTTVDPTSEKRVQVAHATNTAPISRLTKDVYPIIGRDSQQWGTVCILMRLTSFGDFTAHPIHIHQSHNEIILQNTPNTAMYKFVPLDDLMQNKRNVPGSSKFKHRSNGYCTDIARSRSRSYNKRTTNIESSSSSATNIPSNYCSSCTSSSGTKVALNGSSDSDDDLCPAPPGSPRNNDGQYEEFKVEVNDNVLCVRMPKNAGIVRRIYDKNDSTKVTGYLDNGQSAYTEHIKRIPIIRGNRKYPAHYGVLSSFPSSCRENNFIYDKITKATDFSLQCNENRIRQDDSMTCPSDVQIVRKSDDPKRDVFLLKIGKDKNDGIQLEMKTPKNPLARRATNNQTTSSQTYDDEFVSKSKKGGNRGGKKGGKKK